MRSSLLRPGQERHYYQVVGCLHLVPRIRVWLTDKRVIILFQRPVRLTSFGGLAALAAVKVHRQLTTGILFAAPFLISSTIDKKIGLI